MKRAWFSLCLAAVGVILPARADKVEGTLVQVQPEGEYRVILFLRPPGDPTSTVMVSADRNQSREILARGLGQRWTVFSNPDALGRQSLTSFSGQGPDPELGPAFEIMRQAVRSINAERWSAAWNLLYPEGRIPLNAFSDDWRGALLSEDPADWQLLCGNSTRVSAMVSGSRATASRYARSYRARRSSCQMDAQRTGFRWMLVSLRP